MFKTHFFLTLFYCLTTTLLVAQKIPNRVINSTGGSGNVGKFVFSYSVGEPITTTITTAANGTKNVATQGFLQPEIRITGRFFIALGADCQFNIYPNPVADLIYANRDIRDRTFDIYNDIGQHLGSFKSDTGNGIDVSHFAVGIYFIRLACDASHIKILKFIKY